MYLMFALIGKKLLEFPQLGPGISQFLNSNYYFGFHLNSSLFMYLNCAFEIHKGI